MNLKEKLIRWVPSLKHFKISYSWVAFILKVTDQSVLLLVHQDARKILLLIECIAIFQKTYSTTFFNKFHWVDRVHLFQKSFRFLKRSPSLKDAPSNWSSAAYWSNKSIVNQGLSDRYFYPKKWMECQVRTDFFAHNFIYAFNSH